MTVAEILEAGKEKLARIREFEARLKEFQEANGLSGHNPENWVESVEEGTLNKLVRAIKGDRNLPVDTNKLRDIYLNQKVGRYYSKGDWLAKITLEKLEAWIQEKVGCTDHVEIATTLENVFPKYLRNKEGVFDDDKGYVTRHVSIFEPAISDANQLQLPWNFSGETYKAFIRICEHFATGEDLAEVRPQLPTLFDEVKWPKGTLYRWHGLPKNKGVIAVRPMKDGKWRFELSGNCYSKIKKLALANFNHDQS